MSIELDPTDLEPGTFLAKQALKSVARLGAGAVEMGRDRLRARRLEAELSAPTFIEELATFEDDLRTSDSAAIVEFLAGEEVEKILQGTAALQVQDKWDADAEAALVGRLSGGIIRYTKGVSVDLAREIAKHLAGDIVTGIAGALGATGAFNAELSPKAKRVLAKNAALVAKSSLKSSGASTSLAEAKIEDTYIDGILKSVRQLTTKSKMPHLGDLKSVPLASLYVAPQCRPHEEGGSDLSSDMGDVLEAAATYHRLVILGDPGGGKTTTTRRMMNLFAERQLKRKADRSIAMMVVLRDWATELTAGKKTILEVLQQVSATRHSISPPDGVLEELLEKGRVRIFFDGLDELLNTSDRTTVVEVVEGFVHRFPLVPIVVTSRRIGYPQAPLDSDLFSVIEISSFDDEQRREYVQKWFSFEEDLAEAEREHRVDSFVNETDDLSDIATNPLMLSLMCALYSHEQYIPRNRPEVYEKCSKLMFDSWDGDRGIKPTLTFQSHMMGALDALALYTFAQGLNEAGLSRTLLIKRLTKYLRGRRFRTEDEARAAAGSFLNHCSGRAWVLSEVSPERYAFTHSTFVEYFAARQLTRKAKSSKALGRSLLEKVSSAEWDVVCQLALQLQDEAVVDGSEKVVKALLAAEESDAQRRINLLSFVLRCLAFYVPYPSTLDEVADRVVEILGAQSDHEFSGSGFPVDDVLRVGLEIRDEWYGSLAKRIGNRDAEGVSSALRALVLSPSSNTRGLDKRSLDAWAEATEPFRAEFCSTGAPKHLWCALTGPQSAERIRVIAANHGPESLFADASVGGAALFHISVASRVLTAPSSLDVSAHSEFYHCLWQARRGGPIDATLVTSLGVGLYRSSRSRRKLGETSRIERNAIVLAAMGLLELVGESRGLSRKRLTSVIFSGGEASLEGGALLTLSEIDLDADLEKFARDWMNERTDLLEKGDSSDALDGL